MRCCGGRVACFHSFSRSLRHTLALRRSERSAGKVPTYVSATSTSGSWLSVAEKRTFGALSLRSLQGEVRAAYALSRIAQFLYAVPQDGGVAPDPHKPPRRGKDQLEQNEYAGLCI